MNHPTDRCNQPQTPNPPILSIHPDVRPRRMSRQKRKQKTSKNIEKGAQNHGRDGDVVRPPVCGVFQGD